MLRNATILKLMRTGANLFDKITFLLGKYVVQKIINQIESNCLQPCKIISEMSEISAKQYREKMPMIISSKPYCKNIHGKSMFLLYLN